MSIRPRNSPSAPPSAPPPSRRGAAAQHRTPAPKGLLPGDPLAKTDPPHRAGGDPRSDPIPFAERTARNAIYALVAFTVLTVVALAAWFASADQPWGFSSFVALLSALLAGGATALLWRQPTREHAIGGLAVMGVSLLRVGLPTSWTGYSFALIAVTILLAVPLAQAVIVLPRS